MLQDHRQIARERFDRLMRVPDAIAELAAVLLFMHPLVLMFVALDDWTGRRPIQHVDPFVFMWWLIIGGLTLMAYFLIRLVAAAVISALAVRRARTRRAAADRPAGTPAVR